jgi:hypothetical protein
MEVQPTCKAVTRPNQRGARIHPKGCKVRYKVQPGSGYIRKVAKANPGVLKPFKRSIEVKGGHFRFLIRIGNSAHSKFMWDSGATYTSINQKTARSLGILGVNNTPINGFSWSGSHNTQIADGSLVPVKRIANVPLTFVRYGETVTGTIQIMNNESSSPLYGLSHIRNVKTLKVKIK